MAELCGLANNRASAAGAADGPAYGHVTMRTESYEAPKRRKSDKLVTKERTIWMCNYCNSEFSGLVLVRVRGHLAGQPLLAMACGISCCVAVLAEVAEFFRDAAAQQADGKGQQGQAAALAQHRGLGTRRQCRKQPISRPATLIIHY